MPTLNIDGFEFEYTLKEKYAEFKGGEFIGTGSLNLENSDGSYFQSSYVLPINTSDEFNNAIPKLQKALVSKLTTT
jgi:hypothetical protein